MNKSKYKTPAIKRKISIDMETPILAGSVVDAFNEGGVKSAGQEVVDQDFSNETLFNHDWE